MRRLNAREKLRNLSSVEVFEYEKMARSQISFFSFTKGKNIYFSYTNKTDTSGQNPRNYLPGKRN